MTHSVTIDLNFERDIKVRIPKDPPMEGWMNLYQAQGCFWGPQNDARPFEGSDGQGP